MFLIKPWYIVIVRQGNNLADCSMLRMIGTEKAYIDSSDECSDSGLVMKLFSQWFLCFLSSFSRASFPSVDFSPIDASLLSVF